MPQTIIEKALQRLCLCLLCLPLFTQAAPEPSPLSPYLSNNANISATSHQLSRRFDYPIINITREAFAGPEAAEDLINQLRLTDSANTQAWLDRIREAFSGGYDKGFAIQHPDPGLPCLVMSDGSYQDHVLGEGFLNILSEYTYHPYAEEQQQFETMVLYHEIGHCFESYEPVRAEHFADVFSALFLLRETNSWMPLTSKLIPNRTLNLINGDYAHYSVQSLRAIYDWTDDPRALSDIGTQEIIQLAHIIVNDPGNVPEKEDLVRLRTQLQYILLEIAITIDQMDIDYFASDTSDQIEALRDQLIRRQGENQRLLVELFADLEPGDHYAMELLLHDVARSMYRVRSVQNDLYNEVQQVNYRIDVQNLFEAAGFDSPALMSMSLLQSSL